MKKLLTPLMFGIFLLSSPVVFAQVGIGTSEPDPKAMLDVKSTDRGFLPPRMTQAQRDAIQNPPEGLIIYNTDERRLNLYMGKFWKPLLYNEGSKVNQMLYWNGYDWEYVAPPKKEGQVLMYKEGKLVWDSMKVEGVPLPINYSYPTDYVHCGNVPLQGYDVTSAITGKVWMDRNLGAFRAARFINDSLAYGSLFQWGRYADGHQCVHRFPGDGVTTSPTTLESSPTIRPDHNKFFIDPDEMYTGGEWTTEAYTIFVLWKENPDHPDESFLNNPCPEGYRVPTKAEFEAEIAGWAQKNAYGSFDAGLKFTEAWVRDGRTGEAADYYGEYWTITRLGEYERLYQIFNKGHVGAGYLYGKFINAGLSVRCIKK